MRTKSDLIVAAILVVVVVMIFNAVDIPIRRAAAVPLDRYNTGWIRIEDSAAEDAGDFATTIDLDGDEGVWSAKTAEAYEIPAYASNRALPYEMAMDVTAGTKWMFAFFGTDAADETFSFNLVGWAATNGFAQVICEGNGILGTQDVVTEPNGDSITNGFWADTIEIDEVTKWSGAVADPNTASGYYQMAGQIAVLNSGDNEVALLIVDLAGLGWIDFVTYDAGGGGEATSIGVYGRRH